MSFDKDLKNHYQNKNLSDEKIEHILSLGNEEIPKPSLSPKAIYATSGVFVIALLAIFLVLIPSKESQTLAVAQEVAKNHKKSLVSEILTQDYHEIQARLERLNFSILPMKPFVQNQHTLVGGRYCSIQTELAAQIQLQSPTGTNKTLYIVPLKGFENILEGTQFIKGVKVQIWKDEGRLFALAQSST